MKRCPVCNTQFPDDANFCPMDAGRLVDAGPTASPAPPAPPLDLPTMQERVIGGRYQLGPEIGGHRSGQIYSAQDGVSGNEVAWKLIAPKVLPSPLIAQRTERELKQLTKVSSRRVATVIEVGRQGDRLWVATELVPGPTLTQVVAKGRLGVARALRYALEIGEALAEAAKLGVIHRDVSPKNVIVIDQQHVKVINFGVPTPVDVAPGRPPIMGVPEFLAPEQAEGKPVDQRSNIYSLGLLLYYMLVGEAPFTGSVDEVLKQQTQRVAPTPSSRGITLPAELERAIAKALEKSSSRRHMTLRQLLGELETMSGQFANVPPPAIAPSVPAFSPVVSPIVSPVVSAAPVAPAAPVVVPASAVAAPAPVAHVAAPAPIVVSPPASRVVTPMVAKAPAAPATPPPQVTSASGAIVVPSPASTLIGLPAEGQKRSSRQRALIVPEPDAPEPRTVVSPSLAVAVAPAPPPSSKGTPPAPSASASQSFASASRGGTAVGGKGQRGKGTSVPGRRRKGKFRETLWFKKGELDQLAADAAQKDSQRPDDLPVSDKADELPIEDRYHDDGSLSSSDHDRLSLKTGSTQMMPMMKKAGAAGRAMADEEVLREMKSTWPRLAAIIAGVVVVAAIALYFAVLRNK